MIGNAAYKKVRRLTNPVNDATDMAVLLKSLGFGVMVQFDRSDRQMTDDVGAFRAKLNKDTVALFYFSGHGMQIDGENYLLPIDFESGSQLQMRKAATKAEDVLAKTDCYLRILILDACSNGVERGDGKGLNFMKAQSGTLIAFAIAPGSTADDNPKERNGLYTKYLLAEMRKPGVPLFDVFNNVSAAVSSVSGDAQTPWIAAARLPAFTFKAVGKPAAVKLTTSDGHDGSHSNLELPFNPTRAIEIVTLGAHNDTVYSAMFDVAGERVVSSSSDKFAIIWDAATGAERVYLKHVNYVFSACFSPDGRHIVTASQDKTARVWDAATRQELLTLRGHEDAVTSASFSSDGRHVVTTSWDKTARVWDAETGKTLIILDGHDSGVYSASFSPDDRHIVTASGDKTARLWHPETGKTLIIIKGHEDAVTSASFSSDGRRIVTASRDKTARVWGLV